MPRVHARLVALSHNMVQWKVNKRLIWLFLQPRIQEQLGHGQVRRQRLERRGRPTARRASGVRRKVAAPTTERRQGAAQVGLPPELAQGQLEPHWSWSCPHARSDKLIWNCQMRNDICVLTKLRLLLSSHCYSTKSRVIIYNRIAFAKLARSEKLSWNCQIRNDN